MTEDSFDDLERSIMDECLEQDPAFATQVGWHKYDHKLKDLSPGAANRQVESLKDMIRKLEKVGSQGLDDDQAVDRDYALRFLRLRIFELSDIRRSEKVALAASELGNSLFLLVAREHPSFEERRDAITARLESAPGFLESSKSTVKDPWKLWNEIVYETGVRMPAFLQEIRAIFGSGARNGKGDRRLDRAVKDAADAIQEFNLWVRDEIIPGSSPRTSIGSELYGRYIELQDYGVTPDEALSIAEGYLAEVDRQKAEVAVGIVGSSDAAKAVRSMRSDHPADFDGILKEYRSSAAKAREFVKLKALAAVPEGEELRIISTPSYMRHVVPYAAQYEAGRFDDDRSGLFLVTPDPASPETLEEHSYAGIANTTVHEGYPGHHLHGVCANLNKSYLRLVHQSPDFAEGWALYCEDMMISQGYNEGPLGRLATLNDLGFRLARQIADVRLASGRMTLKEAAELLIKETGTSAPSAISEAKAMTLSPTYYCSYFVGKLGVLQMKEDAERALGGRFDLRFFHDSLIYSGCMSMPFMRRALGVKMKEKFKVDLGPPKESIYHYAMRTLDAQASTTPC
jgi:uncharacterized protein (DUF885 family)